jgi:hypothetical protein
MNENEITNWIENTESGGSGSGIISNLTGTDLTTYRGTLLYFIAPNFI